MEYLSPYPVNKLLDSHYQQWLNTAAVTVISSPQSIYACYAQDIETAETEHAENKERYAETKQRRTESKERKTETIKRDAPRPRGTLKLKRRNGMKPKERRREKRETR